MTALPQDVVAELKTRIAELEQQLQASSAENARLEHALALSRDHQHGSAEILHTIASTPGDATRSLQQIAETCGRLFGAPSVSIRLAANGAWTQDIGYGETSKRVRTAVPTATIRIGGPNLPGTVVATCRQIHIPDLDHLDPEMADWPGLPHARAAGTRTICGTPLRRDGKAIGVLIVYRDRLQPFTPDELALQQSFADQAVIAIENARLFDEVEAKTSDLSEALTYQTGSANILKVIASSPTDVDPVLNAIVASACQLCEADDAMVTLKEGDELLFQAQHGPIPVVWKRQPIDRDGVAGRAVIDRAAIHVHDLLGPEGDDFPRAREFARKTGVRTVLCVPLLREGHSIGVIVLRRTEVRPFNQKHVDLLQTFADQAVIAIGNVRLFEEVQQRTNDLSEALQQQTATADVLKVISRSAFDLQAVLETLTKSAVELSGANRGSIFLREGDVFPLKAASSPTPEFLQYWAANPPRAGRGSATSRVIASGKVEIIPDVLDDPEMQMPADSLVRIRAALGVPMLRDNKVEGVLVLTRPAPGPFTKSQIDLVQTFADQAVIAVENARLFNEVQAKTKDLAESLQQQTATADVLKVISRSAFDLQSVLDTLVASAGELCGADGGVIWLRKGDLFHAEAAAGFSPQELAFFRDNPRSIHDKSLAPRVLRSRRTVHIPDRSLDPEFAFPGMSGLPSSMLGVPLLLDDHVEGVFTLARKNVAPFTPRQIELVESFADQAVIAIGNVRLFEQVQARTRELSKSLDDLRAAQDRLVQTEKLASLGQLTAGIAHEIKNPLNFVNNFSALSAELIDELNELLEAAALHDKTREDVDELTHLLKSNLEKVVQHGKRADSIVKNMLLHSREGSGEHRPTDINALVEESLNLAYHGARAEKPQFDVTIERDLDPAAGVVEVFPQEITRVLLNLISNGFYAVLKRKAENGMGDYGPAVTAHTRGHGGDVEIRIRDNGIGIPPDVREKMFTPFFTTKPAGEGTGLGLSMSHDIIVKQHGGTIDVESVPDNFTEFTIRLPRKAIFQTRA